MASTSRYIKKSFISSQKSLDTIGRQYIRQVLKRYQERDRKALVQKNYKTNSNHKTIRESREVVYLRRYDYFLLKNHDDIDFTPGWRKSKRGEDYYFDPSVYEQRFLTLDKHFPKILELKEMYVRFNQSHMNVTALTSCHKSALICCHGIALTDVNLFFQY